MPPPPAPRRLVTRSSARNPLHATRSTQPTPRAKTALPAHDRPPPRLSEKSRRELKSMYSTTGATTNFQSSLGTLLLLRQSPPTPALVRKTALPAHDRPPTPALVRKTALPAHDSPSTPALVRKTALPAHDRPPAPALVRKTALPAHDRPPTSAASAISKMQPSVCEHNHGSQLILHEYIKRTSSHPNRIGGRAFY